MAFKHTKGNWKVLGESPNNYISVGTDNQTVCRVVWGKWDTDYDFANAKLIAAAPKMLQGLIDCRQAMLDTTIFTEYSVQIIAIDNLINTAIYG